MAKNNKSSAGLQTQSSGALTDVANPVRVSSSDLQADGQYVSPNNFAGSVSIADGNGNYVEAVHTATQAAEYQKLAQDYTNAANANLADAASAPNSSTKTTYDNTAYGQNAEAAAYTKAVNTYETMVNPTPPSNTSNDATAAAAPAGPPAGGTPYSGTATTEPGPVLSGLPTPTNTSNESTSAPTELTSGGNPYTGTATTDPGPVLSGLSTSDISNNDAAAAAAPAGLTSGGNPYTGTATTDPGPVLSGLSTSSDPTAAEVNLPSTPVGGSVSADVSSGGETFGNLSLSSTPGTAATGAVVTSDSPSPSSGNATYTVKSGDTLSGIAQANGIPLADLEAANRANVPNPDLIYPGQTVYLPGGATATDTSSMNGSTGTTLPNNNFNNPIGNASAAAAKSPETEVMTPPAATPAAAATKHSTNFHGV